MTETEFTAASAALIEARRHGRALAQIPAGWVPADLDAAYRLQAAVSSGLGETRGWKVSALTVSQQRDLGVPCPVAGPLLAPWVRDSPASFALADFVGPKLECEFAFELGRDLPPRAQAYTRAEVEEAIGALHVVIEVVDSRLPAGSAVELQLGDALNNGAFIIGPSTGDWRGVRYATHAIVLRTTGGDGGTRELAHGDASVVLGGDPPGAVVLLANNPPRGARGLRRGDIITTGSCTPPVPLPGRGAIEADFGALGVVRLRFD